MAELRSITCRMGSRSYLPPGTGERASLNPSQTGRYWVYLLGGIEGRVCLFTDNQSKYLIATGRRVEPMTSRSPVQRPNRHTIKLPQTVHPPCRKWNHLRSYLFTCCCQDGLTPLHCTARSGHEAAVDLLLERGAQVLAKTKNGLGPLHMAVQGDHVSCCRLLLYHKAPIDDVTVVRWMTSLLASSLWS